MLYWYQQGLVQTSTDTWPCVILFFAIEVKEIFASTVTHLNWQSFILWKNKTLV